MYRNILAVIDVDDTINDGQVIDTLEQKMDGDINVHLDSAVILDEDSDSMHERYLRYLQDWIIDHSVEAIEKLPTDKIYVNTADYQGDDFAFYRYGSLRAWAYQALEWAFTDGYDEEAEPDDWRTVNVYRLFAGFKEETIIDTINDYWQIEIAELEV